MKLKRNLYGCKQAAQNWFKPLTDGLLKQGFIVFTIRKIVSISTIKWYTQYVRRHRDEEKQVHPLLHIEKINCEMNALAKLTLPFSMGALT
jgi:hypothetical protein